LTSKRKRNWSLLGTKGMEKKDRKEFCDGIAREGRRTRKRETTIFMGEKKELP